MIDADIHLRLPPPGLRSKVTEAAWNHGYRRTTGEANGWLFFGSNINVSGEIDIAVAAGGGVVFGHVPRWCRGRTR